MGEAKIHLGPGDLRGWSGVRRVCLRVLMGRAAEVLCLIPYPLVLQSGFSGLGLMVTGNTEVLRYQSSLLLWGQGWCGAVSTD